MKRILIAFIRIYQRLLSPLLGPRCCYYPSCSQYAIEAIKLHGPVKGTWLSIKRISRCHPLAEIGNDPVPVLINKTKSPVKN